MKKYRVTGTINGKWGSVFVEAKDIEEARKLGAKQLDFGLIYRACEDKQYNFSGLFKNR